jgi:hypothetical protein
MFHLDDSTLAFFCFLSSIIVAPLTVCGVFAISEFFHQRRKTPRKDLQWLQRTLRRYRCTPAADPAVRRADSKTLSS